MNQEFTTAQLIELFHLAFLQVLQARLNQALYVLKGGTNLRYFFDSLRYSEDIDLDAIGIEPWKLEERIDNVLASPATNVLLRRADLTVGEVNKAKQTETTQRWKVLLDVGERGSSVRTKIEFSHRGADPRRILAAVPDRVVAPYAMRAPTMLHYTADAAIEQKIVALALRSETQARDVFDLELLLRQYPDAYEAGSAPKIEEAAIERIFELPFEAFQDHVLPFLDPDIVDLYDNPSSWDQMKTFVAHRVTETT